MPAFDEVAIGADRSGFNGYEPELGFQQTYWREAVLATPQDAPTHGHITEMHALLTEAGSKLHDYPAEAAPGVQKEAARTHGLGILATAFLLQQLLQTTGAATDPTRITLDISSRAQPSIDKRIHVLAEDVAGLLGEHYALDGWYRDSDFDLFVRCSWQQEHSDKLRQDIAAKTRPAPPENAVTLFPFLVAKQLRYHMRRP